MKTLTVLGSELKLRWSPTFAQKSACPAFLKYNYVDKVQDVYVRVAAERGKAAHEAIAELVELCMAEEREISDLTDVEVRRAIKKHTPPEIASELGNIIQWVELWRERFEMPANIVGVEERVALNDEFDECPWKEASYRGILDLVEIRGDLGIITDWKSQPNIISQTEFDDPFGGPVSEQFTNYAWLMNKMYPHVKRFVVRLWFLRYGFYIESRRVERDLHMFEEMQHLREQKLLELDNWNPVPGKHCQYCDFIRRCSLARDLSPESTQIISQEQAILAAQQVTVMQAKTKELNSGLKTYVENNDDVRIGDDYVYGYHVEQSEAWDAAEVSAVLSEAVYDPTEVMRVDVKAMRKLIKEAGKTNPVLAEKLQQLAKTKRQTRFKGAVRKPAGG